MRYYERGTALALILIAAVAMNDSLRRSGWTSSGPDAGFYPFWSAAAMAAAALVVLVSSFRMPPRGSLFGSSEGVTALAQLLAPLFVLVWALPWVGFYVASGAYMAVFARWIGRYSWVWVVVIGLAVPLALFFMFERGFKVPLPKSYFYADGIVPF